MGVFPVRRALRPKEELETAKEHVNRKECHDLINVSTQAWPEQQIYTELTLGQALEDI